MDATDAFKSFQMRAEFIVRVVVTAFAHEVKIELAEQIRKCVGVQGFGGFPVAGTVANAISGRIGLLAIGFGERGFKEAFRANAIRRDGFGKAFEKNAGLCCAGAKETYDPAIARGRGNRMRTEECEGIGMTTGDEGVDLGVEIRVGGAARGGGGLAFFSHGR